MILLQQRLDVEEAYTPTKTDRQGLGQKRGKGRYTPHLKVGLVCQARPTTVHLCDKI